jgi:hypothetical protein
VPVVVAALLVVLGGFLVGGVLSVWPKNRAVASGIGLCAVIAVAAGILRMVS